MTSEHHHLMEKKRSPWRDHPLELLSVRQVGLEAT
jgi:hypothetical protein